MKHFTIGLTAVLIVFLLMRLGFADQVKGSHFESAETYQTSLGTLKFGLLLQNGNKISMDGNNLHIIFGFIHIGTDEARPVEDNVGVFQDETNLSTPTSRLL